MNNVRRLSLFLEEVTVLGGMCLVYLLEDEDTEMVRESEEMIHGLCVANIRGIRKNQKVFSREGKE